MSSSIRTPNIGAPEEFHLPAATWSLAIWVVLFVRSVGTIATGSWTRRILAFIYLPNTEMS